MTSFICDNNRDLSNNLSTFIVIRITSDNNRLKPIHIYPIHSGDTHQCLPFNSS